MNNQEKHDYLISLIKELEKLEDKQALNNFIIVMEDLLKVKYRLRNYFDYPISAAEYDELTTYAENLLGVNRFGSADDPHYEHLVGRTNDATSVDSAKDSDIINQAIVDYALIDMKAAEYIVDKYTPDQLTIDIVLEAAEKSLPVDGFRINKQTADYIVVELKKKQKYWSGFMPNKETIAAIEEAIKKDPKDLKTWDEFKKEMYADKTSPEYQHYWGKGSDILFFYNDEYVNAWKCADIWHKDIYYWPYNEQYIVGQVNLVEWYKTKGDEAQWGPIFGPFESPEELDGWYVGFWNWWHALSDENKVIYHNIPSMDNQWPLWNTNYIEMFRKYAAIKNEYDYNKIATEAQNDKYAKMKWEELPSGDVMPKAFTKEWNEKVADLVGQIKKLESNLDTSENVFDGEIIQFLEKELLNLLKGTL